MEDFVPEEVGDMSIWEGLEWGVEFSWEVIGEGQMRRVFLDSKVEWLVLCGCRGCRIVWCVVCGVGLPHTSDGPLRLNGEVCSGSWWD